MKLDTVYFGGKNNLHPFTYHKETEKE